MSHEDILDDMSLSDDELLDSLADDLLLEMEDEEEEIQTVEPVRAAPRAVPHMPVGMPMGFPFGGGAGGGNARAGGAGGMPDISQMMQQMMPMMSQMFGGAGGAPGMRGGNASLQQAKLSWDEIVKQHVPANEQDEWLATIRADEKKQRDDVASQRYNKPPSRSYHGDAKPLPNVYMESETLLASLLNESVRAKKAEHNAAWKQYHENLVSHATQSGLAAVYARELKDQLLRRVASDPDYAAARKEDPSRFSNIAKALAV